MEIGATPKRAYVLLRLSVLSEVTIDSITNVPYQTVGNFFTALMLSSYLLILTVPQTFGATQAPMHPRLQLMLGGSVAVVQFGDAVTLCARGSFELPSPHLKMALILLLFHLARQWLSGSHRAQICSRSDSGRRRPRQPERAACFDRHDLDEGHA